MATSAAPPTLAPPLDPKTSTRAALEVRSGVARPLPKPKGLERDARRKHFRKRLTFLQNNASIFLEEGRDVTDYIRPRRGVYLGDPKQNRASRRSKKIINSTGTIASRTLGSGMTSGVSSPARPWFNITVQGLIMRERADVRQWLFESTHVVQTILAKSNFYDAVQQFYRDLGDFGNACMVIDENFRNVINCTVFSPGQYFWALGEDGRVNTLYAKFNFTVIQLVEKFGYENCSDRVRKMYDDQNVDESIKCVMAIEPNMHQLEGVGGPRSMPFIVIFFEEEVPEVDAGKERVLKRSGYREWPVAAARWEVQAGEDWGTGPGLDALGDVKALQQLERRKAQAVDKLVSPPLQSPTSPGAPVSQLPGGLTHLPSTTTQSSQIRPLYEQRAEGITALANDIENHEYRIRQAYYADLFLMLANDTRQQPVTAREIEERHQEKLLALGPVLDRLHNEALNVAIERTFMVAYRAGLISPAPEAVQGLDMKIEYTSILAQAQRSVSVGALDRLTQYVGALVQSGFQTAADKFDPDQAIDEYAAGLNVPPSVVRSDEAVAQMRQEKAAQIQQEQAMEQAQQMAPVAKTLAETPVNGGETTAFDLVTGNA